MNKYKSITSFVENGVTYMRLGDVYGWYTDKNGERYGMWFRIKENKTTEQGIEENWEVLRKNVKQTLELI